MADNRVTILDLLENSATSASDLRTPGGARTSIGLAELWRDSEAAANWLSGRTSEGDSIAISLSTSPEALALLFGAWRAGLVVASIPDPLRVGYDDFTIFISRLYETMQPEAIFAEPAAAQRLSSSLSGPLRPYHDAFKAAPKGRLDRTGSFVQFTSGSTQMPAGARLGLTAIAANVSAVVRSATMGSGAHILCSWLPLSHDMGLFGGCLGPLCSAAVIGEPATAWLLDPRTFGRRPTSWLQACSDSRATITLGTTTAMDLAVRFARRHRDLDLSNLRSFIIGAEKVRLDSVSAFGRVFAPCGFETSSVRPAYGLAENTLAVSIADPGSLESPTRPDGPDVSSCPCGPPIDGTEVSIENPHDGVGELAIRGTSLFDGYVGSRQPRYNGDWFLTGDLGSLSSEGHVVPMGRSDDVINVRGRNIYPADVEAIALGVTGIRRAVAIPDGLSYALIIETDTPHALALTDELRVACVRSVQTSPSRVITVQRHSIPLTPTGKPRRRDARRLLESGRLTVTHEG